MSAATEQHYTPQEYLELERRAERKHEYYRGQIFLMSGASLKHNFVVANVIAAIHSRLKGKPCQVLPSDLRVKCPSGLYTYPDVIIVCGEIELEDTHRDTLLNPTVLFEVLSPSTEAYDRGVKSDHYRGIASLEEYVLIAQDRQQVEVYQRADDAGRWSLMTYHHPEELVSLRTGDVSLPLKDIYENVNVAEPAVALRAAIDADI